MKRKALPILIIIVLMASFGCVTLKTSWNKASEDERARLILFGFQKSLKTALIAGIDYVVVHPEKKADWQNKVIPMFDATNKILLDLEIKGMAGEKLTVVGVSLAIAGKIAEIEVILRRWGVTI